MRYLAGDVEKRMEAKKSMSFDEFEYIDDFYYVYARYHAVPANELTTSVAGLFLYAGVGLQHKRQKLPASL
jgi:hypothetical protein